MEHSISVRGLKIRYLEKGLGLPFVLLHGFSFSADTWVEMGLFDELSKEYTVYSFDMPYGSKSISDKFDAEDRDEYAVFLKDLLKYTRYSGTFSARSIYKRRCRPPLSLRRL